jgi:hypothetical protein
MLSKRVYHLGAVHETARLKKGGERKILTYVTDVSNSRRYIGRVALPRILNTVAREPGFR